MIFWTNLRNGTEETEDFGENNKEMDFEMKKTRILDEMIEVASGVNKDLEYMLRAAKFQEDLNRVSIIAKSKVDILWWSALSSVVTAIVLKKNS